MNKLKLLLHCLLMIFPWFLRRRLLNIFFKYKIHPKAKIGFSIVMPASLEMNEYARIGHFTIAVHLDTIILRKNANIGRNNWITGFSTHQKSLHFKHQPYRKAMLIVGESSSITKRHHLDCTNEIIIGKFVTIAGYDSQFLTHSINLKNNYQDSNKIIIGDYCFIGSNVMILGGSSLPSYSVLGAKSLLNKNFNEEWTLYGGVPAICLQKIPKDYKYFTRSEGYVY
ncbi:MAG: acyltransferase [Bacteroidetes bacterium]|nr:acyltransferase [Bacteroidota bacterium]